MDIATLGIRIDASQATAAAKSLERFETSATSADSAVQRLAQTAGILAGAFSVREIAKASDTFQSLNAQLEISTGTAANAARAYGEVFRIARQSGQELDVVATIYRRLSDVSGDIGVSQDQVARTTESVAQAMALSGASAASAQAALVQFGQGLAAGTLRGEELNSVLEQAPRLARALADGLGIPVGRLRELAATGAITSKSIINALNSQGDVLEREFGQLPLTIGRALTNLNTAFIDSIGNFEKASGVFAGAAQVIDVLATNMDVVAGAAGVLAAVYGGRLLAGLTLAAKAKFANRVEAQALAVAEANVARSAEVAAVAELAAAKAAQTAATQMAAAGLQMNSLAAANTRLAAAQAAASAAATRSAAAQAAAATALSRTATLLGFFGGPIGLVTTALTLGATAWSIWGAKSEESTSKASESTSRSTKEIVDSLEVQIKKLRERNQLAESGFKVAEFESPEQQRLGELQARSTAIKNRTGEFQGINDVAQMALLKQTGLEIAKILDALKRLKTEQEQIEAASKGSKASQWLKEYATDAEKLKAELLKAREELGKAFSPELGRRIVEKFANEGKSILEITTRLKAQAAEIRKDGAESAQNLFDQASQRRRAGMSPEEASDQARRQASELSARATLSAGSSLAALRDGDLSKAKTLAEQATKLAERAAKAADQIADNDIAARQFDELGRLQEKITQAQAGLKETEIDQIAQAKVRIDGLIDALSQPVNLNLNIDEATAKIMQLQSQIQALAAGTGATIPGITTPVPQGDPSGSISMGGKTVQFNQTNAVTPPPTTVSQPDRPESGGYATMGDRTIVFDMGSGGKVRATTDANSARTLERTMIRESMRSGR